jgi:phage tail P2-like protein
MTGLGAKLLYPEATGFERALADTESERLLNINAELIIDNWDPYKTKAQHIPHLAFAYGVRLWDDTWSLETKRQWVANYWDFEAHIGTIAAYRMALAPFGFELVQYVAPPQGFYASPEMSKEEYDNWVRLMPQVRIALASTPGKAYINEFFAGEDTVSMGDDETQLFWYLFLGIARFGSQFIPSTVASSFADEDVPAYDDGPLLYGRRAVLRLADGTEIPLKGGEFSYTTESGTVLWADEFSTPGRSLYGFVADVDFSDNYYAGADEIVPEIHRVNRVVDYEHTSSELGLTLLRPSLTPLDTRFEQDSDHRPSGPFFFEGDFMEEGDEGFANHDEGGLMLVDRMYLLDPDVTAPMTEGWSFADVDRVGMPQATVEVLVDLNQTDRAPATYVEEDSFADFTFALVEDMSMRDKALKALTVAKSLRDTVLVSTAPKRQLEFGDDITEETEFGDWVTDAL